MRSSVVFSLRVGHAVLIRHTDKLKYLVYTSVSSRMAAATAVAVAHEYTPQSDEIKKKNDTNQAPAKQRKRIRDHACRGKHAVALRLCRSEFVPSLKSRFADKDCQCHGCICEPNDHLHNNIRSFCDVCLSNIYFNASSCLLYARRHRAAQSRLICFTCREPFHEQCLFPSGVIHCVFSYVGSDFTIDKKPPGGPIVT